MAKSNTPAKETPSKYIVIARFRDKDNWDVLYEEGADVSDFDKARLEDLVARELVEKK